MKPILFNTEMVKKILDGRKTQTRRVIKLDLGLADTDKNDNSYLKIPDKYGDYHDAKDLCRYQPGDILWVRETWQDMSNNEGNYVYLANGDKGLIDWSITTKQIKWKPSIHMPKKAARIFLRVTDVRVERLQDITEMDAWKEGCPPKYIPDKYPCSTAWFHNLWQGLNKKRGYGWNTNPWVWVIEFERVGKL